jgi:TonB family protein
VTQAAAARDERNDRPTPQPAPIREIPTSSAPPAREGSPQGSPMASGSSAEISGFDDPDFTYGYYADLMLSRIREHWERPPLGGEIELVVHFRVRRDGSVADLKVLRSSGYNSFDRAGLQAIQRAQIPPLPKSYRPGSLGVRIRVH